MKEYKKENDNDIKLNDKIELPRHNYITINLLIKRGFIQDDSDIEVFMYDALFEELLQRQQYDFKTILVATSYVISSIQKHGFKDQYNRPIQNLYPYFRSSLLWNLKKITGQIDLGWLDDDWFEQ